MADMDDLPPRRSTDGRQLAAGVAIALVIALAGSFGLTIAAASLLGGGGATPTLPVFAEATPTASPTDYPVPTSSVGASPSPSDTPSPGPSPSVSPSPTPTPTAAPSRPPLPAMLAAIGDSYTQAYSVSPSYKYDHAQFSWVVGTQKGDGVNSLLERFRSLGGSPVVVDAATSGRKMNDAVRQAKVVTAAAAKLGPGRTVYVTFELGTNDLCDDPKTSSTDFLNQLKSATDILATALPKGSRLLMIPVPDFRAFHAITQADPAARAALALTQNSRRCAPFLGTDSPLSAADAALVLATYDNALKATCAQLDASVIQGGNLACTYNEELTSDRDFTIKDLSTVDYFHPSLSGQAKMAADAWQADLWGR